MKISEQYNLLSHPFYLAWNEGTLTRDHVAVYAREYGCFIELISKGWHVAGENKIAGVEKEHNLLWQNFAESLGSKKNGSAVQQVKELVNSTNRNYQTYAGSIGALYAFEAQQPATASSKLQGLKKHYSSWLADETYFMIHENDFEEPALLEEKYSLLPDEEKIVAADACTETCRLLWNALTGIYASLS